MGLEQNVCRCCNKSGKLEYLFENRKVVLCKKCNGLFKENKSSGVHPNIVPKQFLKLILQKCFSRIQSKSYIEYLKQKTDFSFKTALDIGSGVGYFVKQLNQLDVDAYGIESDELTVKHSVTLKNKCKHFDEDFTSKNKYDLISLNQILYYFNDSYPIIHKIAKMLNKNGLLLITTMNPESTFWLNNETWAEGSEMWLSKKNFSELNELGLKLVDISSFKDNFWKDFSFYKHKKMNIFLFFIKTISYLLKIKKTIEHDTDGIHNYLILKKI